MKTYYPYKSDKPEKKFYIITKDGKKVYFGATGYEDYTMHKDDESKKRYIGRHQRREDWSIYGIDTSGWWSRYLLWNKKTLKESYDDIKKRFSSVFNK
jgi:hypothetical protein